MKAILKLIPVLALTSTALAAGPNSFIEPKVGDVVSTNSRLAHSNRIGSAYITAISPDKKTVEIKYFVSPGTIALLATWGTAREVVTSLEKIENVVFLDATCKGGAHNGDGILLENGQQAEVAGCFSNGDMAYVKEHGAILGMFLPDKWAHYSGSRYVTSEPEYVSNRTSKPMKQSNVHVGEVADNDGSTNQSAD